MRIAFCGWTFPSARSLLSERLAQDQLVVCHHPKDLTELKGIDVLVPLMTRIDATLIHRARPRLIQQWGSGLDGIDLAAARAQGVPVASVPTLGGNAESVAEHIVLLTLSLLRRLPEAQANVRAGILGAPMGRMLAGRTVCLWGLGSIALALSRRLLAFDARLLGISRDPRASKVAAFSLEACYSVRDSAACLNQTDVLIVCVRLGEETRGIVDANALANLTEGACLINAARGALVNYQDLYAALASGRLSGAGLDVFWDEPVAPDDPLLALPNVIATPHVAGVTDRSYREIADAVALNIERLRRGEPLLNRAA